MTHNSREKNLVYVYEAIAHGLPGENDSCQLRYEEFNELIEVVDALPSEVVFGLIDSVGLDVVTVKASGRELIQSFILQSKVSASFRAISETCDGVGLSDDIQIIAGAPPAAAILPASIRTWRRLQCNRMKPTGYYFSSEKISIVACTKSYFTPVMCDEVSALDLTCDVWTYDQNKFGRAANGYGRCKFSQTKGMRRAKHQKK